MRKNNTVQMNYCKQGLTIILTILTFVSCAQSKAKNSNAEKTCIKWGINGHPLTQHEYKDNWSEQVNVIQSLGLDYYRIDVPLDPTGLPDPIFPKLCDQFKSKKISVLPVLLTPALALKPSEVTNMAFKQGQNFAIKYGQFFKVVEVGNEEDNAIIKSGAFDGTKEDHYDLDKAELTLSKLRGIINGIRSVRADIKIVISLTWVHFYYLELLKKYKVSYDYIGYHWYSDMGNITNVVKPYGDVLTKVSSTYNKTVWITEFNFREGSLNNNNFKQAEYIKKSLADLINHKNVGAFFIYELFDQPSFKTVNPGESEYGLARRPSTSNEGKVKFKDAFIVYKSFISKYKKSNCK